MLQYVLGQYIKQYMYEVKLTKLKTLPYKKDVNIFQKIKEVS